MALKLSKNISEAPRPQDGASRKGNIILIVPLNPTYKAGLAGHFAGQGVAVKFFQHTHLLFILQGRPSVNLLKARQVC